MGRKREKDGNKLKGKFRCHYVKCQFVGKTSNALRMHHRAHVNKGDVKK